MAALGTALLVHALPSVTTLGAVTGVAPESFGPVRFRGGRRDAVALTFDDGPSPWTPSVLDALGRLDARATFFVTGTAVLEHPGLLAEILARGHQVESHGMAHQHHLVRSPRWVFDDLRRSLEVLGTCGVSPRFVRPPFGQAAAASLASAAAASLTTVLWSEWGREWVDRDARSVGERVLRRLGGGSIVLLHDSDVHCGSGSVATVLRALPVIVAGARERGLSPVTMTEMCESA